MNHPESKLQQSCVRWFRLQYPKYLIFANANGGYRSPIEAKIMQAEGVLAGVPDLTVLIPCHYIQVNDQRTMSLPFFIEMKSDKGRLTPIQKERIEQIQALGYAVHVCRSLDEFMNVCKKEIGL